MPIRHAICIVLDTDTLPDSEMSDDCVWPLSDVRRAPGGRPGHTVSASVASWEPASNTDTAADRPVSSSPLLIT